MEIDKAKIVKFILGLIFFSIFINYLGDYIDFKTAMFESTPISYSYIDKRINRGGRGETYEMDYQYNNIKGTLSITSKEYDLIEDAEYPELFYSKRSRLIFSKWEMKKAFRITILFLALFIIAIFPWNRLPRSGSFTRSV